MKHYLYSPYELAVIVQYHGMDIVQATSFLEQIYHYDNPFIQKSYRGNQKKFILDVMEQMNYINNQEQFDLEKASIEQDLNDFGILNQNTDDFNTENTSYHLIFKELRLRILYINKQGYAKIKLRNLLAEFGYKRRSSSIINYILDCMFFYHISVSLRGNVNCDLNEIDLDETIVFRVI